MSGTDFYQSVIIAYWINNETGAVIKLLEQPAGHIYTPFASSRAPPA